MLPGAQGSREDDSRRKENAQEEPSSSGRKGGGGGEYVFLKKIPTHCNENPNYVFQEKEFGGLSPNFYIHVSVSDLYIPRIGPHIFLQQNRPTVFWEYINSSQAHECRNEDCGRAVPFWEYLFRIFGIATLQFSYFFVKCKILCTVSCG